MKYLRNISFLLVLALAALMAVGCQKDVGYQTSIVLKTWSQESSGDELYPITDVVMYGFATDTTLYTATSYEDALAGVLTSRRDPSKQLGASLSSVPCTVEGYGQAQMMPAPDYQSLLLLVVNKQERLYGYTQLTLVENLPYLYISVQFQPWKEESFYKNGNWWMCNDDYVPNISCVVRPKSQQIEGGEKSYLTASRLFAYAVESPEAWAPADWENAEVGRLVNSVTGEVIDPSYSFSADTQGNLSAKFPPDDYLLMVVNAAEQCYALRAFTEEEIRAESESEKEDKGFELLFPFWDLNAPVTNDQGWVCHYSPSISISVTTTLQRSHNSPVEPLTGSTLYIYGNALSEDWLPATLEDASVGLLTHRLTGEQLTPEHEFPFKDSEFLQCSFPLGDYLFLVVNGPQSSFALRNFNRSEAGAELAVNFPVARVGLPFTDEQGWEIHYMPNQRGTIYTYIEEQNPDTPAPEPEKASVDESEGEVETPPTERLPLFPPYVEPEPAPMGGRLLYGSLLHAYRVEEPDLWLPRNLADAREGILYHTLTGERIEAEYTFTAASSGAISLNLPLDDYLLQVVNYESGCYALRNLSSKHKVINASILFPVWRNDLPLTNEAGWRIFYTPNVRADINLSVQFEEESNPIALDCAFLYAYRVDNPADWQPETLEDALAGRLSHKESGETAPIFYAYEAERGESSLTVDFLQDDYLILVASSYGCSALYTLTADSGHVELALNFEIWRTDSPFTNEAGWSIYTWPKSSQNPEEPEEPENPEEPETPETPEEPENPEGPETTRK